MVYGHEYLNKLIKEGKAESTINQKLASLASFYAFLSSNGVKVPEPNPFNNSNGNLRVKINRDRSGNICLSHEEVKKISKVVMKGTELIDHRNRVIFMLLVSTDLKRSELVDIKVGDIKKIYDRNVIEVTGRKVGAKYVIISQVVKDYIDKNLVKRGLNYNNKNACLLVNHNRSTNNSSNNFNEEYINKIIKDFIFKANVKDVEISPNSLRYSYMANPLELGLSSIFSNTKKSNPKSENHKLNDNFIGISEVIKEEDFNPYIYMEIPYLMNSGLMIYLMSALAIL
jgi:site-specific recombinase XerD